MHNSIYIRAASLILLYVGAMATATAAVVQNECVSPPSGTVFCEDFEGTNPKSHFNDYDGNSDTENQIVANNGPASSASNKVIRLRVPEGQRGGSDLVKVLPSSYDRLYARWYFQYEPGFNFNAPNHGGGLTAGDRNYIGVSGNRPTGNDFAYLTVQYLNPSALPFAYSYYRGMYQDCANPDGQCWGDSLPCVYGESYCSKPQHRPSIVMPTIQAGRWYCVEEMLDMGTPNTTGVNPNGRFAIWLDDQVLGDYQDLWLRTTTGLRVQNLWLSLFHHDGTHSTVGEMIDNVVVSTQRVGCGAATAASLNPPANLRIVP
ncbi:MAG: hypothetical protein L0Y67_04675 [Gammaproteobacteria bacterium]|nr:hypothetical protein [Gammaproteobacteria bacterium]